MSQIPVCQLHKKVCFLICKEPSCPDTFICDENECIQKHFHSPSLISVNYMQKKLHDHLNLVDNYFKQGKELIDCFFDQFEENLMTRINQYKQQALKQLQQLKERTILNKDLVDIIENLQKDFFGCSKSLMIKGWEIFKDGNEIFFEGCSISKMISQLRLKIKNVSQLVDRMPLNETLKFVGSQPAFAELQITQQQQKILFELLNSANIGAHNLELLFDARKHDFKYKMFHKICDYKGATLTIVRTNTKSLFGGYNPISWTSQQQTIQAKGAFLFSVDFQSNCVSYRRDKKTFIYDKINFGPSWGIRGQDLNLSGTSSSKLTNYIFSKEGIQNVSLEIFQTQNFQLHISNFLVFKVNQ